MRAGPRHDSGSGLPGLHQEDLRNVSEKPSEPRPASDPGQGAAKDAPDLLDLFLEFLGIAAVAFGGVLPWVRYALVERRRWLTPDEFTHMLALCQLLPGPNIVNLSIAVGARFHGAAGSAAALLGLMGLPVALVLGVAALYARFAELASVRGALIQVAAAAAGLVIAMAVKMAVPLLRRRFVQAVPFMLAAFVAVGLLRLPLVAVVLVLAPFSVAASWRR